jgi:alpha-mannosidase
MRDHLLTARLDFRSIAFAFAAFCPIALHAQLFDSQHPHTVPIQLSAGEQATLDKLNALRTLPDSPRRFHVGDIAHGESVTLDDSLWPVVTAKSKAPKEAVWYRRVIEVPKTLDGYDLTGTTINFRFAADANGPIPEILYFNGRRVAMGDDLEAVELFANAKPGEKILVAVKLLPTVDVKQFDHVDLDISFAPSRPNPEDLRQELVSAGTLIPSLAPGSEADRKAVTDSINQVDCSALEHASQSALMRLFAAHKPRCLLCAPFCGRQITI